jgi:hypothetical protein
MGNGGGRLLTTTTKSSSAIIMNPPPLVSFCKSTYHICLLFFFLWDLDFWCRAQSKLL